MRLLTYTNLYPSEALPRHGIFVEERLRHLLASGEVNAEVCALRPRNAFGEAAVPAEELRHGVRVHYVAVPTLPKITNWIDPLLWAGATQSLATRLVGATKDDIILDAHFLYPDAVAAVILGRRLGVPVVMSARGSDVNVKCENPVMRRWVRWAARRCAAVITVSQALAERLAAFGIARDRLHVLPNGVDLEKFQPRPDSGRRPPEAGTVLLSAGHLLAAKGHHIAVEALPDLPDTSLLIVGEGPEESALKALVEKLGVASRVRFLGYVAHEQMADLYSAADFTVLASANEGMPNVVLESLACGTRVIATDVGGVAEVMTAPEAGSIMKARRPSSVVECVVALRKANHSREATRAFATRLGWDRTVERQLSLYEQVLTR